MVLTQRIGGARCDAHSTSGVSHELPRDLAGSAVEVPPKPAAPTPGLRTKSLPHSAAGMNPCPTVIKS